MLAGHAGIALAAKAAEPRLNLGLLFFAAMAVDTLGCVLELAGLDAALAAGIAHSLSVSVCLAAAFYLVWIASAGKRAGGEGVLLALVALSHWPLDWLVHEPDLPLLWPGGLKLGYGLWRQPPLAVCVELGIASAGLAVYVLRSAASRGRRVFTTILVAVAAVPSVVAAYAQRAMHSSAGEEYAIAAGGLVAILAFSGAAAWADRRRPQLQPR